jgi:hypothetical protein
MRVTNAKLTEAKGMRKIAGLFKLRESKCAKLLKKLIINSMERKIS